MSVGGPIGGESLRAGAAQIGCVCQLRCDTRIGKSDSLLGPLISPNAELWSVKPRRRNELQCADIVGSRCPHC